MSVNKSPYLLSFAFTSCGRELNSVGKQSPCLLSCVFTSSDRELNSVGKQSPCLLLFVFTSCDRDLYFILSSEINVYQKWIKVVFSQQN